MKRLLLSAVMLIGFPGRCLALDQKDSIAIAAGAVAVVGIWSWLGHVSNENIIKCTEYLWQDCHAFVGKQEDYLSDDLDGALYLLGASPILKKQSDIVWAYKSLSKKMSWCWNRSYRMKQACEKCGVLKKSLDEYLAVFNMVKQQIAAREVAALWNGFSLCDLAYDPSCEPIKGTTLQKLSEHRLLLNGDLIGDLYLKFYNAPSHCCEYADAHKKIVMIKRACDTWLSVCDQIRRYDDIVRKYQDFIVHLYQPRSKQDFAADARLSGSGEFPLLDFIENINVDIRKLSVMTLCFSYVRLQNGGVVATSNALSLVDQHLRIVASMVVASNYYQDELCRYREKLRLQEERRRLAAEQQRLWASVNKVNCEIEKLKYENLCLRNEIKKK